MLSINLFSKQNNCKKLGCKKTILLFSRGFTIVEVMIVVLAVGVLSTIVAAVYIGMVERATVQALKTDAASISKAMGVFQIENRNFPATVNCSISDSSTNKCISPSNGATVSIYQYDNNSPKTYCLTISKSNYSYSVNSDNEINAGPCPVLYLDAGNTLSYPGSGTVWYDISGNSTVGNCTLYNGLTTSNKVMDFDGVNDFADCGDYASYDFGTGEFTIEAWIKYTGPTTTGRVYTFLSKSTSTTYVPGYVFGESTYGGDGTNVIMFSTVTNGEMGTGNLENGASYIPSSWYHLVVTRKGTTMSHYRNGSSDGTVTKAGVGANVDNAVTLKISENNGSYWFKGQMGKIRMYNKALTQTEAQNIYNQTKAQYGL